MKRIATITKLKPGQREIYKKIHDEISAEVAASSHMANMRNFTMFIYDDYLFSYYEYVGEDFNADMAAKMNRPVSQAWAKLTGSYTDLVTEDTKVIYPEELWHYDF